MTTRATTMMKMLQAHCAGTRSGRSRRKDDARSQRTRARPNSAMTSEEALLNDEMRSSDDYERHLVAHQDEASAYTTYATFLLEREDDAPGARKVLERGLKTILPARGRAVGRVGLFVGIERKHGDDASLDATTEGRSRIATLPKYY